MVHRARRTQAGQSTLEYILVLAAIIAAVAVAAGTVLKPAVDRTFNQSGETMQKAANKLSNRLSLP